MAAAAKATVPRLARLATAAPVDVVAAPDEVPEPVALDVAVPEAVEFLSEEAPLVMAAVALPTGAVPTGAVTAGAEPSVETTDDATYEGDVAAPAVVAATGTVTDGADLVPEAVAVAVAVPDDEAETATVGAWSWPSVYWLMGAWGTAMAPMAAMAAKAIEARILTREGRVIGSR